jgi:mRNA-degrading endonuclease RelE of RelBE toxin-antitoxin system
VKIETTAQFERSLDALPLAIQEKVEEAIPTLAQSFGKPHAHLGIRKLGHRFYEYRIGLQLRIVFRHDPGALYLLLIGTHDEVRRLLRHQ